MWLAPSPKKNGGETVCVNVALIGIKKSRSGTPIKKSDDETV